MGTMSDVHGAAEATVASLRERGLMAATAESCTGGLVAGAISGVPGSSSVLHGGFVTYANTAKTEMVGVPAATLAFVGAVSREVAAVMAAGARARTGAGIVVSVTGVAGPDGGSPEKPVGTVWFGVEDADGGAAGEMLVSRRPGFGAARVGAAGAGDAAGGFGRAGVSGLFVSYILLGLLVGTLVGLTGWAAAR